MGSSPITSTAKTAAHRPKSPVDKFRRLRHSVGLDHVRLHDLRHFVATTLLGAGVDLRTVAGRLGHAGGGRTTLAVYAHFQQAGDRVAADLLGHLVSPQNRTLNTGGGVSVRD